MLSTRFNSIFSGRYLTFMCALLLGLSSATVQAGNWQQNVSIGGFNNVHIYTPDSDSPLGGGKSLLLVLHGCVQPINNFLSANLEDAAEAYGMVVAVPDAMNKAGYSCWSYWQGAVSRSSGDYKNLINLANTMSADPGRNIDPDQVYISGLSSGGAMAAQTGCLAPDVFAGVAPSAGPTIGTSSGGAITSCENVSTATFKSRCESYAGSYKNYFSTQIAVVGHGTADTTVNTCYNQQNANGFATLYGVSPLPGTTSISEGAGHTAEESLWADSRVSMLWLNGLDHSWSGGAGASGGYVAGDSINFASYLGSHFAENNQRVNRNAGPVISNHSAIDNAGSLAVSGNAVDAEGSVATISINIADLSGGVPVVVETLSTSASPSDGYYSADSGALIDGLYQVVAVATDNEGVKGQEVSTTTRVGPEPAASAPVLSDINAVVNAQCAVVSGTVIDANQNIASVVVEFSGSGIAATVQDTHYSAEKCSLAGGNNVATVTATDATGLSQTDSISFTIDAGVTGDYNLHIAQGHISWGVGYSACYLQFGVNAFTMREYSAGSDQCNWIADGASACAGPAQACATGDGGSGEGGSDADGDGIADSNDNCPNDANTDQSDNDGDGLGNVCDSSPDGDSVCNETTASNYSHVQAGRATTNGFYTYAVGSEESMGLYNIFYTTTLAEISAGYFEIGTCP